MRAEIDAAVAFAEAASWPIPADATRGVTEDGAIDQAARVSTSPKPAPTYSHAFAEGVKEEMRRDPSIIVLGTDMLVRGGHWSQLTGVGQEFGPTRVFDTPISEAAMVAAGVGAAVTGLRPIVDLNFVDFAFGAMDEIINQAAKLRYMIGAEVPVVIRATAGIAGGAEQHNNSLDMWFAQTPGLHVAVPAFPADSKALIKTALRGSDPVVFLMHKKLTGFRGPVGGEDDLLEFGRAATVRAGTTMTIVAYGHMVHVALKAAEAVAAEGIDAEVIDLRTIMPLDMATIEASVRRTGRAMVVTDAPGLRLDRVGGRRRDPGVRVLVARCPGHAGRCAAYARAPQPAAPRHDRAR